MLTTTRGPTDDIDPKNLILRLPDLPAGYRVGEDSSCSPLGVEGSSDALTEILRDHHPRGCDYQFENHAYYMTQG